MSEKNCGNCRCGRHTDQGFQVCKSPHVVKDFPNGLSVGAAFEHYCAPHDAQLWEPIVNIDTQGDAK